MLSAVTGVHGVTRGKETAHILPADHVVLFEHQISKSIIL